MHQASADNDLTGIDLSQYVVMRQARQPKRVGELLKLAARLVGELPAPNLVTVSATCGDIDLGFDGSAAGVTAMAAWASHYETQLTGEHIVMSDGTPAVHCTLSFTRDGTHIEAYAYVKSAQAA
jgi:hypothetical protein